LRCATLGGQSEVCWMSEDPPSLPAVVTAGLPTVASHLGSRAEVAALAKLLTTIESRPKHDPTSPNIIPLNHEMAGPGPEPRLPSSNADARHDRSPWAFARMSIRIH
jgi:hypothetical protein